MSAAAGPGDGTGGVTGGRATGGATGGGGTGDRDAGAARPAGRPRRGRRVWMILGLAAIGGAIALLVTGGLSENVVFFLTPAELEAKGADAYGTAVRLGGQVKPGTVSWDPESRDLRFTLTDGDHEVEVRSTGAPPAMFRDGMGVVVEGRLEEDAVFRSTNVMVKHSNEYRPPSGDEHPRRAFESLIREEGG